MAQKKILLVDDEDLVVRSIDKLLKKQGHEVLVCRSGEEALEKIKTLNVDLLVTDVRMPGISGVELIKKIREYLGKNMRPAIKEIIITGYAEDDMNKEAESLKVADYIYKPFDLRDFMAAIDRNTNS